MWLSALDRCNPTRHWWSSIPLMTQTVYPPPQIFTEGLASFLKDLDPRTLSWWSATGCYRGIAGHLWLPIGQSFVLWRWHTISNWHAWCQWKYQKFNSKTWHVTQVCGSLLLYDCAEIYVTALNIWVYLSVWGYMVSNESAVPLSYHHSYRTYCRGFSYT